MMTMIGGWWGLIFFKCALLGKKRWRRKKGKKMFETFFFIDYNRDRTKEKWKKKKKRNCSKCLLCPGVALFVFFQDCYWQHFQLWLFSVDNDNDDYWWLATSCQWSSVFGVINTRKAKWKLLLGPGW